MSEIKWDGTGYPPVGCECLFIANKSLPAQKVKILALLDNIQHGQDIVYKTIIGVYGWNYTSYPQFFRPILSEKDEAINKMMADTGVPIQDLYFEEIRSLFGILYDAGYRKQ
jgi:hypothetical protein